MSDVSVLLTECPNCRRALDGAYCAGCGQKVTALNPTFHDCFHDLTHELLHVDGKIFRSVRLLTSGVTRTAGRNYPQDLYFAFHTHAAVFACATVWMLLRSARKEAIEAPADIALLAFVSWYLVVAFRTAYGGTWRRAVGRAAAIGVAYFLAIVMAITAVVLIALWI